MWKADWPSGLWWATHAVMAAEVSPGDSFASHPRPREVEKLEIGAFRSNAYTWSG
jgi:hypothetical protein